MERVRKLLATGWMVALFAACGNAQKTPFTGDPAQPIFTVKPSDFCKADANGVFPDNENVAEGETDAFFFGEGGGCIKRPILDAWGVTHNLDVMLWDAVTKYSYLVGIPPKKTSHFYEIRYVVNATITVKWTMQWYHTVGLGDKTQPKLIWINYKRVAGTQYIPYWEGTLFLEEVAPGVTAFAMRNQIQAAQTDASDAGGAIRDVLRKIKTAQPVAIP